MPLELKESLAVQQKSLLLNLLFKVVYMIVLFTQHGRIKVRTTAEQAEAKRKEREKKLKIYAETTSRIYEKVICFFHCLTHFFTPIPMKILPTVCHTFFINSVFSESLMFK